MKHITTSIVGGHDYTLKTIEEKLSGSSILHYHGQVSRATIIDVDALAHGGGIACWVEAFETNTVRLESRRLDDESLRHKRL